MANKVKFKRGANSGYASMLSAAGSVEGEPHWITDTYSMYVATGTTTSKWVGAEILDEDTLNSDSATKLATQQSIKAYVDAQVTAQDLDISADSGSNIAIDLDSEVLAVSGGEGIDTSITGNASNASNLVILVIVMLVMLLSASATRNTGTYSLH